MAIFLRDKSRCLICGQILHINDEITTFPAFLPSSHKWHKYSDGIFHSECFRTWENSVDFNELFRRYKEIWDSRPDGLQSIEEINEWGATAFKDIFQSEPNLAAIKNTDES